MSIDLKFSSETEAFRAEVRTFLRDNLPDDLRRKVAEERMELSREDMLGWHKVLNAKGWACVGWPHDHGGPDWTDEQHYVFERELAMADAPRPVAFGVHMLGPTLIKFASAEQKERFLPDIINGDVHWCQGFSEPNAGSDLASLQCRADRDGDDYVINGSKTWTTDGHIADWMFGLFRTDNSGKKQHGITFLLIDMMSPGVSLTPILTFDGGHEVNQVFFDDVRVPVADLVGEEHQGWTIAKYLLGLERFGTADVSRSIASMGRLKRLASRADAGGKRPIDDPDFATRLAEAETELRALEITEQRFLFGPGGADAMGAGASMLKVRGTEVQHLILELTMDGLGYYAHLDAASLAIGDNLPAGPPEARHAAKAYFNTRKTAIYSGSNEIQKNIIAKAVLGL